ncbi:MAG: hypothetical protein WCO07_02660 [bacterium]
MDINFLKPKKNFTKKEYQVNFDIYWKVIIFVFFIIIISSFFYGFSFFVEINKDFVSSNITTNVQVEQNRKVRLDKILEYFKEREKKSEKIINSSSPVVDPSI